MSLFFPAAFVDGAQGQPLLVLQGAGRPDLADMTGDRVPEEFPVPVRVRGLLGQKQGLTQSCPLVGKEDDLCGCQGPAHFTEVQSGRGLGRGQEVTRRDDLILHEQADEGHE